MSGRHRGWRDPWRAQYQAGSHVMHAPTWLSQGAWQRQIPRAMRAGTGENALLEVEELGAAAAAPAADPVP